MIKINSLGKILSGEYNGWYITVKDDFANSGGYLILYSRNKNFKEGDGFDDWVESKEALEGYFEEAELFVSWM